jgi:predicted O-linked N-acetylglucosamine transferase (SPINDLY family)
LSNHSIDQLIGEALSHHRANRLALAESLYRQILGQTPANMIVIQNLAVILRHTGRIDECIALLEKALTDRAAPASIHFNLGNALADAGRNDEALAAFQRAAALAPADSNVHNNLGLALRAVGDASAAIAAYRRALVADPRSFAAMINLGGILCEQGQLAESIALLKNAIELAPNITEAHHNLALALHGNRQFREALAAAGRAIALNPRYAPSYTAAANLHHDLGEISEALAGYRRAIELFPADAAAHSNLLLALAAADNDPAAVLGEAKKFGARFEAPLPRASKIKIVNRRIRVAYLSPDFRQHSVAHFIEPLLANHVRADFEIICYSDAAPDAVTARLRPLAEKWRDTRGHDGARLAAVIESDAPDILIDLAGHTSGNRLPQLARRLAPLQGSFLGYPATTGVPAIDFRITDAIADPPGVTERLFTERLIRLPRCAWCYAAPESAPPVTDVPPAITFGSFNHIKKISPRCIDVWSQVLARVPSSQLVLKSAALADERTAARIIAAFAARGIEHRRLALFSRAATAAAHLATYANVAIALDTFPYNGTTTTCEALWMGVPVVTLKGSSHAALVGTSLLFAAGLEKFAAGSAGEFVDIAADLAGDRIKLAELRRTLRDQMRSSPLMDGAAYAKSVEAAYKELLA